MLKKLIKHEIKDTKRFFIPMYLGFAAILVLERLSLIFTEVIELEQTILGTVAEIIIGLVSLLSVLVTIAVFLSPYIYSVIRFYKSMICDEGYLTLTLPVKTGQLIKSKLIVSLLWQIITLAIAFTFGILFFMSMDFQMVSDIFTKASDILGLFSEMIGNGTMILLCVLFFFTFLSQTVGNILSFYNAMSIGQTFQKNKFLVSAGIYIGIQMAIAAISQVLMLVFTVVFQFLDLEAFELYVDELYLNDPSSIGTFFGQMYCWIFVVAIVMNILLSLGYYFVTKYFMTKKLNLS